MSEQDRKQEDISKNIYFISGHLDLSDENFETYYKPLLNLAIEQKCSFVVGDAKGADAKAQNYLWERSKQDPSIRGRVTVYHIGEKPRNNPGFQTKSGFIGDDHRDVNMTKDSTDDILWIRSAEEAKKLYGKKFNLKRISGTEQNKLRRLKMNSGE